MTTTAPEIRVFATFPQPSDSNWVHCLTFPLNNVNKLQFTPTPYKWIRYAIGAVLGAQGDISFSNASPHNVIDYNVNLLSESVDLFYHISDAERQRMFPVNPDLDSTITTSSDISESSSMFLSRGDVADRDGSCVLTGFREGICDAAYLLPQSKGDDYIATYTRHRSRDPAGNDIVDNVNDIWNRILLNKNASHTLGKGIAFLMTPNFAMSTADIDATASPTEKRCTGHLFIPGEEDFGSPKLRSGCRVRMPDTTENWPPGILSDAAYANAVLYHFAAQTFLDTLKEWNSIPYPGRVMSAAEASQQAVIDERVVKRRKERNQARDERPAKRQRKHRADDELDTFDMLLIMPYIFVPPHEMEEFWREAREKREEAEKSRVADKVASWAKDVADASL